MRWNARSLFVLTTRIRQEVVASFWFIPALISILSATLAGIATELDGERHPALSSFPAWLTISDIPAARSVLATLASSAITVMSIVLSITMVSLSLASSQLGPRLLPNFLSQGKTQVTIGAFIGTFIYALFSLSRLPSTDGVAIVPQLTVLLGLLFGVSSFFILIFFIHHVASFIQISRVLGDVSARFEEITKTIYPSNVGEGKECWKDEDILGRDSETVSASTDICIDRSGYVETVDAHGLMEIAKTHNGSIELMIRPGQFVVKGARIAVLSWPDKDGECEQVLNKMIGVGPERTMGQDVELAFLQVSGIALRALSPGVNDPLTASMCINHLVTAIAAIGERKLPSACRYDEHGKLRLILLPFTYCDIVSVALDPIVYAIAKMPDVNMRLLESIEKISDHDLSFSTRKALCDTIEVIRPRIGDGLTQKNAADARGLLERACSNLDCHANADDQ